MPVLSGLLCRPCCLSFIACHSPCGQTIPLVETSPGARRNGICNRKFCAAPSRRAHGISLKNPTITGHDKPWEGACPDIETTDAHCFSRALLVALFCTAFVFAAVPRICCPVGFLDCGESYRSNISGLRAGSPPLMSLLAHTDVPRGPAHRAPPPCLVDYRDTAGLARPAHHRTAGIAKGRALNFPKKTPAASPRP